eukprot:gene37322-42272_t
MCHRATMPTGNRRTIRTARPGAAYTRALTDAGIMVGGGALLPSHTATTVRLRDGSRDLHDGPYAETKEQLGGFYIIDVPDLDTALEWAARNPAASTGVVEVPERFGYEAAIQAVHVARRHTGVTDWPTIEHLYRGLLSLSPTLGVLVGHAVAVAQSEGPEVAIRRLDEIPEDPCRFHQPYWAARAHLLEGTGREAEAAAAYDMAIALTEDAAARRHLLDRRAALTA